MNELLAAVSDEGRWMTAALGLALLTVVTAAWRRRPLPADSRAIVAGAMSLFFGVTIGVMALGHVLVVTMKWSSGALAGTASVMYLIGAVLMLPSWWLSHHAWRLLSAGAQAHRRTTLVLNLWTAASVLALGLHNLPLAAPGLLSGAYQLSSSRLVGRMIVLLFVIANAALFIGSLLFLASGQSFEEFRGLE